MNIVSELVRDMSLWKPQREGLEVFDAVIQAVPVAKGIPKAATIGALAGLPVIQKQIKDKRFDLNAELTGNGGTDFPSFCFAIATGGGQDPVDGSLHRQPLPGQRL